MTECLSVTNVDLIVVVTLKMVELTILDISLEHVDLWLNIHFLASICYYESPCTARNFLLLSFILAHFCILFLWWWHHHSPFLWQIQVVTFFSFAITIHLESFVVVLWSYNASRNWCAHPSVPRCLRFIPSSNWFLNACCLFEITQFYLWIMNITCL
jgi:hypothetical protein